VAVFGALDLRIPSDVAQIEPVVAEIVRRCEAYAFNQRQLALNLPVALTEALSNAILRGNGEDAAKSVRVRVSMLDGELTVEVEDEGMGFDLDACTSDPSLPENLEREEGRGLFLMRALMDRVESYRAGGNVVRLTLRCRGHAA
jgi:serine/threonine-protein kinase RsbW